MTEQMKKEKKLLQGEISIHPFDTMLVPTLWPDEYFAWCRIHLDSEYHSKENFKQSSNCSFSETTVTD